MKGSFLLTSLTTWALMWPLLSAIPTHTCLSRLPGSSEVSHTSPDRSHIQLWFSKSWDQRALLWVCMNNEDGKRLRRFTLTVMFPFISALMGAKTLEPRQSVKTNNSKKEQKVHIRLRAHRKSEDFAHSLTSLGGHVHYVFTPQKLRALFGINT